MRIFVFFAALGVLFSSYQAQAQTSVAQQAPTPVVSDDVPAETAQRVRALAERQPAFIAAAGRGRVVFVGVELIRIKPTKDIFDAPSMYLYRAIHYRYADNVTVYSDVDLPTARVAKVSEGKDIPTPLSAEERKEAVALALADKTVISALGKNRETTQGEALGLYSTDPKDAIYGHRAVSVFFKNGELYVAGLDVVVDLTAKTVVAKRIKPQQHDHEEKPQ